VAYWRSRSSPVAVEIIELLHARAHFGAHRQHIVVGRVEYIVGSVQTVRQARLARVANARLAQHADQVFHGGKQRFLGARLQRKAVLVAGAPVMLTCWPSKVMVSPLL